MIPDRIIAEMREGADRRYRAKVATMTMGEVRAEHDRECAIVEAAIRAGRDVRGEGWILDRIAALQEVRTSHGPALPPIEYHVPWVTVTHEDGHRLRYPVRCF